LIFQIIDDKKDCYGIYANGDILHTDLKDELDRTWGYSSHLGDKRIDLAQLYCGGLGLTAACPPELKDRFEARKSKLKAFVNSFLTAKINLHDICFYDLVPEQHIRHYYDLKNQISEHVFENYPRPKNYTLLHDTTVMCHEISDQEVKLNRQLLKKFAKDDYKAFHLAQRFWKRKAYVNYNIFGTKTGRLGLHDGSFPILNLKREHRAAVEPKWNYFVELDYNGSEIRTLMALSGQRQPKEDIHKWNMDNIFEHGVSRDVAKKRIFSWLYNSRSNTIDSEYYDRQKVLDKFYKDGHVQTPFGRCIESDDFHALNYLLQSTSSDNCLTQANKLHRFLRDKKSKVAFIIHDSVILDFHFDERHLLPQIREIFMDTKLGSFKTNVKVGTTLGNMQELKW